MSQVLKAAVHWAWLPFFSSSLRIPWLYPPYTPSGVEGASKCCSSSGGVIGENVTGAAATIPGGEAEVSPEAFVAISMAVFAVVSPVVYPVVCLAKCLESRQGKSKQT